MLAPTSKRLRYDETLLVQFIQAAGRLRLRRHLLLQQFLGLVDLGRQVRAAASIGVVEEHQGSVGLADLFLGEGALAGEVSI